MSRKTISENENKFYRERTDPIWNQWLKIQGLMILGAGGAGYADYWVDMSVDNPVEILAALLVFSLINFGVNYLRASSVIADNIDKLR
jgi:hypothetical protein